MSTGLSVLGKVLESGGRESFRELDRDLFIKDEQDVYDYVRRYLRRHRDMPYVETVEDETGIDIPETDEPITFYMEKLEDRYLFNEWKPAYAEVRRVLTDQDDVRQAMPMLQGMVKAGMRFDREKRLLLPGDIDKRLRRDFKEVRKTGKVPGITTSWEILDSKIIGHQNGDLNVIVSRMGVGKTMILLRMALAARTAGASVLFVSMEMPADQLERRVHFLRTGINPKHHTSGQLSWRNLRAWERSMRVTEKWKNLYFYNGNMEGSVAYIEDLVDQIRPDIIFIDGMYLLRSEFIGRKTVDRYMNVSYVTDELKRLAIVTNRPVVCTTQFNRMAGKGGTKGSLENMGFSDTLAQHGSNVWALRFGQNNLQRELASLKAREGGYGVMVLNYIIPPDGRRNFDAREWYIPEDAEEDGTRKQRKKGKKVNTEWMD